MRFCEGGLHIVTAALGRATACSMSDDDVNFAAVSL
jgi:hypothetical protein